VLLPFLERLFPVRQIPLVHRGIISDVIYTYEPWVRPACYFFGLKALQTVLPGLSNGSLSIPKVCPVWVHVFVIILLSEITFYAVHRLCHKYAFLWEFHRVHHSSTSYQSMMTARFHPVDSMIFTVPYIFALQIFGINLAVAFWFGVFQAFMDRYAHSNINGPRLTGYFLNTPFFHAWHHSNDPRAMNTNFGRNFVFIDYIMGSAFYPKSENATDFGEPSYPSSIHLQIFKPFYEIFLILHKKIISLINKRQLNKR
jgi:hypothetical protein